VSSPPVPTSAPAVAALPLVRVALAGVVAGFTSGLFGVGGGIVIVPVLALAAGFPHKLATGTSLAAILPIAVAGAAGYAVSGEVDWPVAACVSAGSLVGAVAGTRLLVRLGVRGLQVAFAAAMVVTAVRMLADTGSGSDGAGRSALTLGSALVLVAVGVAAGTLAGLLGVGGGVVVVPALTLLFGVPLVVAKGTSLLVIVPTAVAGTLRNRRAGLVALGAAGVVGGAGIASAFAASRLSLGLDPTVSSALFAALLVVVAVRLTRTALAGGGADPPAAAPGGPPE
jgi:uncharacterized protein